MSFARRLLKALGDFQSMIAEISFPILLIAAELGKGVASEAAKSLWQSVTDSYRKWRGEDPPESGLDAATTDALLEKSPELIERVQAYAAESSVIRRASLVQSALSDAKILWIDDHPEWNILERRSFESLGIDILPVESTRSAVASLASEQFDLIISDIARQDRQSEGIEAFTSLRRVSSAPVVYYVGTVKGGTPIGAFGIASSPVELLHLCMDALERSRL
jgi:CheY-like chemotaxis protein